MLSKVRTKGNEQMKQGRGWLEAGCTTSVLLNSIWSQLVPFEVYCFVVLNMFVVSYWPHLEQCSLCVYIAIMHLLLCECSSSTWRRLVQPLLHNLFASEKLCANQTSYTVWRTALCNENPSSVGPVPIYEAEFPDSFVSIKYYDFFSSLIIHFQKFKHEQVEDVREFSLKSSGKYWPFSSTHSGNI